MIPVRVMVASETLRAMPKSVSLIRPSLATRTLPGLTSRWVIPAACAASSAEATAMPTAAACSTVSGPWSRRMCARLREGSSSITTNGWSFSRATSCRMITFG